MATPDQDFHLRVQDWLDGRMSEEERAAFEAEIAADAEKARLADKLKAVNDQLKRLNEDILREDIPDKFLDIIRRMDRASGEDGDS